MARNIPDDSRPAFLPSRLFPMSVVPMYVCVAKEFGRSRIALWSAREPSLIVDTAGTPMTVYENPFFVLLPRSAPFGLQCNLAVSLSIVYTPRVHCTGPLHACSVHVRRPVRVKNETRLDFIKRPSPGVPPVLCTHGPCVLLLSNGRVPTRTYTPCPADNTCIITRVGRVAHRPNRCKPSGRRQST